MFLLDISVEIQLDSVIVLNVDSLNYSYYSTSTLIPKLTSNGLFSSV